MLILTDNKGGIMCGEMIPNCGRVGILGSSFFSGDEKAKEDLFSIIEDEKVPGDSFASGDILRSLAACYLYDERGKMSAEDTHRLEKWEERNTELAKQADQIRKGNIRN